MAQPILFTPDDVADYGSYFTALSVIAADAATRAEDPLEQRDFEACSCTWAHAAAVINQTVGFARRCEAVAAERLRVVGGTDVEGETADA